MSDVLPYEYTHKDYEKEKQGYINDNIDKLKNMVHLIEARPDLFPKTLDAIAIYSAMKDKKPKNITLLSTHFKNVDPNTATAIDAEIKKNAPYFNELADISWRNGVVEMLIDHLKYNPKKAGEDGHFQKALLDLFIEYLEEKYIKDIEFIHTSLEKGLFLKKRPDSNWAVVSEKRLATKEAGDRKRALMERLDKILAERKETEEALSAVAAAEAAEQFNMKNANANAALKALANLENGTATANGSVANLAARMSALNVGSNNKNENVMRAVMESHKSMPTIFNGLPVGDVLNLRTLESLNAFIRSKFSNILKADILTREPGNVYQFMGYKGLPADNPLQQLKNMHQIKTSGDKSNCLIHTFLTMTCEAFRKLPKDLKDDVASSFRFHLYPRFAEVNAALEPERRIKSSPPYSEERQPNLFRILTEDVFLNDSDVGWLTDIYRINAIIFQSPVIRIQRGRPKVLQPAIITFVEKNPGDSVYTFSNNNNNHYESVQNRETGAFTISHGEALQINGARVGTLAEDTRVTGCRFKEGDQVHWNGSMWHILDRRTKDGGKKCLNYIIADKANYDIFISLPQVVRNYNPDKWVTADGTVVMAQEVGAAALEAQNPAAGGARPRRQTRRHRLKSKRHHSFRNPR
jgi:hypothetical protein